MRLREASTVLVASLVLLVVGADPSRPALDSDEERDRVARHLDRVARDLRTHTPAALSAAQRRARAQTLDWLDEYRAQGRFPHNHVRPGERVPVFVDPHGTPCAVGYLLLRSGEHALVEEIVRTDNLVRVAELAEDSRLREWLRSHGLTLEEAARIQPTYGTIQVDGNDYEYGTVGLSVATAALVSYMAMARPDRSATWVDGLVIGAMVGHGALFAVGRGDRDRSEWAVGMNAAGFVLAAGAEVWRLTQRDESDEPPVTSGSARALIRPGVNGTEFGISWVH